MPLPTALKKWISDCKAYAAKHNCSYKQAMTALKKLKKSRKSYQGGSHSDLAGSSLSGIEAFGSQEGATDMKGGLPPAGSVPAPAPAPAGGDVHLPAAAAAGTPPVMGGGAGLDLFAVGNTQQTGGRRRRRRGSKSKRRGQSQNQNGGKRRKSRRGRRRSSRGGSALGYSQY